MYRYTITTILCIFTVLGVVAVGAMAANSSKTPFGWANVSSFCKTQSNSSYEYKKCISLVNRYKQATKKHFRNLPAAQLKRIGDNIRRLADKNSKSHKNLRDAIKGIGDTIRKPIEVPDGVRRRGMQRQQLYIK